MPVVVILLSLALLAFPLESYADDDGGLQYRDVGPNRGGRVTAVAGTAAEPGTFYLGATGGGVWKTEDYGTTWRVISDGYFGSPSIGDISVAPNDPNIIYVGTGSDGLRSNVIAGDGMYKSVNGGNTWVRIGLERTGHIGAVEIDPTDNNVVWVAAIGQAFASNEERGVYKSVDGGKSWSRVLYVSDTVGFSDLELLPGNPNVVFATAWKALRQPWTIMSGGSQEEGGLYKSVDGGKSWRKVTAGLPQAIIGKIDLAVSAADSSIVYALVEAPDKEGGLYRSTDQGETFEFMSTSAALKSRPFYYANVEADPVNPDVVYAMANDFIRSDDGGKTWTEIEPPHADSHDMWINPDNPRLFIQSNDGGANVTHNGGETWSTQFNQATSELYTVDVDDQYPYWLYAGQQDNATTIAVPSMPPYPVQHQAAWVVIAGGCETGPSVPKPGDHNIVYAACKGQFNVYDKRIGTERRYDVGAANMYGNNPKDLRYRFQRVSPIHVSPHDPAVIYHASQFVHRTTDEGKTWEVISPDLTAFEDDKQVISGSPITRDITGEEFYSTIYSLRESSAKAGVIWSGANDGPVYVTQDNGGTWTNVTPRSVPAGGRVDSVDPSPHDAATAYIAIHRNLLGDTRPYILRTSNYGKSWTLLTNKGSGIPENVPTRVVREDPVRPGLLYAGTDIGVFVSFDDGASWQSMQYNLPVTQVTDLKIFRDDLVLSTMGRGFWILDDITPLRQPEYRQMSNASEPLLFQPRDTVRYRKVSHRVRDAVPSFPTPGAYLHYYLAEDLGQPLRLEIIDASGALVVAIQTGEDGEKPAATPETMSGTPAMAAGQDGSGSVSCDAPVVYDEDLASSAGFHRYSWDMRHFGPWTEPGSKQYADGPVAVPGRYTVRLRAGERVLEQELELQVDPRVAQQGVTAADLDTQLDAALETADLLSQLRRTAADLNAQLSKLEESGADSAADASRIRSALSEIQDEKMRHPKPRLINQTNYLYNILNEADQLPGRDALERLATLQSEFAKLGVQDPCGS